MSSAQGIREHHYYLDKEGRLFFEGAQLRDAWTFRLFQRTMTRAGDGRYLVVCDGEHCYIEAEDVPYVVTDVNVLPHRAGGLDKVELLFGGGWKQTLDPATLVVGRNNVLYCSVRRGEFTARFSRKPYYTLSEYVETDGDEGYYLSMGDVRHYIKFE